MKRILFTGTHRNLLADEIFDSYNSDDLTYYLYHIEENVRKNRFSYWTWPLEKVIAKNFKHLVSIKEVNEKEYLKITSLTSIGLTIEEAFEVTFDIG